MKNMLLIFAVLYGVSNCEAQLLYKGRFKEYEGGMNGIYLVQPVTYSPDGKNCYIGSYNGFTWYTIDYGTQMLTYNGTLLDGGDGGPGVSDGHGIVVSPDGRFIYLASGYMEHSISIYQRNTSTGAPTYQSIVRDGDMGISNMKYPYGMDMDSRGHNIYVACKDYDGNAVVWFARNVTTGAITYMNKFVEGVGGATGIQSADDVDMSPDNRNVYVTAFGSDAITWYNRDTVTGDLTFGGVLNDNTGGVDGLDNPYWVEVSPDGNYVYVGAQDDNSIAWFARSPSTGALSYKGRITDASLLAGTRGLSIHPSGNWLLASASYSSVVAWFSIDRATGALTYSGHVKNGENGVEGIGGTRYNNLSPDGTFFVATGYGDNGVAWFSWNTPNGITGLNAEMVNVDIYPNPASRSFSLSFANGNSLEGYSLHIFNSLGSLVSTQQVQKGKQYQCPEKPGIYIVKLQDKTATTTTCKRLTVY